MTARPCTPAHKVSVDLASSGSQRARRELLQLALLALATACTPDRTGASARAAPLEPRPTDALRTRPLLEHLPAAGLRWLALARPAQIFGNRELLPDLERLVPRARLDAFAAATGVRLETSPLAVVADYGLGTVYAGELPGAGAQQVKRLFRTHLRDDGVQSASGGVERIVGTTPAGTVAGLVVAGDSVLVLATGDVTLARIAEAYARGRLRSPAVMSGAALSALPPLDDSVIAGFFAPGPFDGEWASAAGGLVGSSTAVALLARRITASRLRLSAVLAGTWDEPEGDGQALNQAWLALRQSETGGILGLKNAEPAAAAGSERHLSLSVDLPAGPLIRGLYHLTSANIWEILDIANPEGSGQHAPSAPHSAL